MTLNSTEFPWSPKKIENNCPWCAWLGNQKKKKEGMQNLEILLHITPKLFLRSAGPPNGWKKKNICWYQSDSQIFGTEQGIVFFFIKKVGLFQFTSKTFVKLHVLRLGLL